VTDETQSSGEVRKKATLREVKDKRPFADM
jgi:hypothetical protein